MDKVEFLEIEEPIWNEVVDVSCGLSSAIRHIDSSCLTGQQLALNREGSTKGDLKKYTALWGLRISLT